MRLPALEVPDEPAELAGWLERHLVGPELAALVAELEAVHGPLTDAGPSARSLLGSHLEAALLDGLATVPPPILRRFLRRPRLLLDLQGLILAHGGAHWDRLAHRGADLADQVEDGRRRLFAALPLAASPATLHPDILPMPRPTSWHRSPWLVAPATAASVLLAAIAYDRARPQAAIPVAVAPTPTGWGWSKPGALPQDLPPGPYLARLADDAEDWFHKRPETSLALARRIAEFRQGCSTLILTNHRPLAPPDQAWLIDRCRAWATKLDAHLAALEAGADPAATRAEADATVRKLINALRDRAARLAG